MHSNRSCKPYPWWHKNGLAAEAKSELTGKLGITEADQNDPRLSECAQVVCA